MKINSFTQLNKKYIYISPGGFLLPYLLGICHYVKSNYNIDDYYYIGSSAGSWCATYLASDMNLDYSEKYLFNKYSELFDDKKLIYKWHNIGNFLQVEFKNLINKKKNVIPNFIKERKVEISLSQYSNKRIHNYIINDYNNVDELLNMCQISSYIPLLSGYSLIRLNDKITFDGALSHLNLDDRNVILNITNDMFNRSFYMKDVLGIGKYTMPELYILGYLDSENNKNLLDIYLLN